MGDIKVGDVLYSSDGSECSVTYVSPEYHKRCFLVIFDNGQRVICDEDHLWTVRDYKRRKNDERRIKDKRKNIPATVTGEVVLNTLNMADHVIDKHGGSNYSVDLQASICAPEIVLPINPYVLGVWLGDGTSSGSTVACSNDDYQIIQNVIDRGYTVSTRKVAADKCPMYSIGEVVNHRNSFTATLSHMDLIGNKHIPESYKFSSTEQRLELVRGLLDTDGYIDQRGHIEFGSVIYRLANDFKELISSLGIKSRFRTKIIKVNGDDYNVYLVTLNTNKYRLFNLERKYKLQKNVSKKNTLRLYILSISEIESVPTQCITVDSPDETFLCTESFIPTHNTSWGPWWLWRECYEKRLGGDYIAVTASFDLFKLKMLPAMLAVYEQILGIGRYWTGDRIIELKDPVTGKFLANKSQDPMWGRIILRSADALGGLESSTSNGAWLDEAGQDRFTFEAYKAVRRRVALKRGRILMTTTLYNLGWVSNQIIDPAIVDGTQQFMSIDTGEIDYTDCAKRDTAIVQFDSIINPAFSKAEYEEQRDLLPEEEFSMQYRGRKSTRRFLIFDSFDTTRHICEPFIIPASWRRYIGLDFGGNHTCCVYYAEDPISLKLYAYREYLAGGRTIEDHVKQILAREESVPFCAAGSASEGQWRMEFGQWGLTAFKPAISDLDLGINRVYAQHQIDGIIYFKTLHGIIDEKGRYRRKRDINGVALDEIKDKSTFHFLDAERYIISTIRPGRSLNAKVITLED